MPLIFDGTLYAAKAGAAEPTDSPHPTDFNFGRHYPIYPGYQPIHGWYASQNKLNGGSMGDGLDENGKPTQALAEQVADRHAGKRRVVLDWEPGGDGPHWSTISDRFDEAERQAVWEDTAEILSWMKSHRPDLEIGCYHPGGFIDDHVNWTEAQFTEACQQCVDIIGPYCDFWCPDMYIPASQSDAWVLRSIAKNARVYRAVTDKPIYPFISCYQKNGGNVLDNSHLSSSDRWAMYARAILAAFDGAVLWVAEIGAEGEFAQEDFAGHVADLIGHATAEGIDNRFPLGWR